MQIDNLHSTI